MSSRERGLCLKSQPNMKADSQFRPLAPIPERIGAIDIGGVEIAPDIAQVTHALAEIPGEAGQRAALMAPAEVPQMIGKGLRPGSGSSSLMASNTPTW